LSNQVVQPNEGRCCLHGAERELGLAGLLGANVRTTEANKNRLCRLGIAKAGDGVGAAPTVNCDQGVGLLACVT